MRHNLTHSVCWVAWLLASVQCHAAGRTILIIVQSASCPPCRQFDREFVRDITFRNALNNAFELRQLCWENPDHRATAVHLGVNGFPAFVIQSGRTWARPLYGFVPTRAGKANLLAGLGLSVTGLEEAPPPPPEVPSPPGDPPWNPPPKPNAGSDADRLQELQRSEAEQLRRVKEALQAVQDETTRAIRVHEHATAERITRLQAELTALATQLAGLRIATVPQTVLDRITAIETQLKSLTVMMATLQTQLSQQPPVLPPVMPPAPVTPPAPEASWPEDDIIRGPPADPAPAASTGVLPRVLRNAATGAAGMLASHAVIAALGLATGGLAVPVGAIALRAIRRSRARRASAIQPVPASSASAGPETKHYDVPRLPLQSVDYSTAWAEHWVSQGLNPRHEAQKLGVYVDAIRAVETGALELPGVRDRATFAKAIRNWANKMFIAKVGTTPTPDNFNHKAFFGFLHRRVVDNIRQGMFSDVAPDTAAADTIEDYVNQQLVTKCGVA